MGDSNMKRFLSIIFSASLIFGMGTSAFADVRTKDANEEKAISLIEKTNEKIDEKIKKAKEEADKLKADYLADIHKINEEIGKEVQVGYLKAPQTFEVSEEDIQEILFTLEEELIIELDNTEDHLVVNEEKIAESTLEAGQNEVEAQKPTLDDLLAELLVNTSSKKYEDRTIKYVKQLDHIITKVFYETKKMSEQTIEKASKLGVKAQCQWVQHFFADVEVWIDPIQIVGI